MKSPNFKLFLVILFLFQASLFAGEASGGGVPEVPLVECDGVLVEAPIGSETTQLVAVVFDKDLTKTTLRQPVDFRFDSNKVHFYDKFTGPEAHGVGLSVETEPQGGKFAAVLSVRGKSKEVSCQAVNDRFRPLADREVNAEFRHGGKQCFESGQCVGFISGVLPLKRTVPLTFHVKTGQLEGNWKVESDVFGSPAIFELNLTQKRDQPPVQQFTISLKASPNPTVVTTEGLSTKVHIETPALRVGNRTVSIWQQARVTSQPIHREWLEWRE
jgi:hypothetical protein